MPALTTHNRRYRIAGGLCLAAAVLWLSSGAAVGQPTAAGTEQDEQAIALFKELLKDPTNVDLNFRYAEAAVKQGNYEGAISALERLLLYNPNFPGVKLQLAELYARLGCGRFVARLSARPHRPDSPST
jgi:Flp pilus assembly protein TadD